MKLDLLYKDEESGEHGCPSVYLAEDGNFVIQGDQLTETTAKNLKNVLPGETAVLISPEVVLGAVKKYNRR